MIDRRGTGSDKWDKYKGTDIIPMWVADMDFACADEIKHALNEHVAHGVFGYTVATDELTEVVKGWLKKRYGWAIESEWLVWTPGLVPALNVMCRCVGDVGDEVITFVPVYPPFLSAPGNAQKKLVTSRLKLDNGRYVFDVADLEKKITDRTRVLILCSPHNPVGRAFEKDELEKIARICAERDVVICSDEVHCDLILDEKEHVPTAMLGGDIAERTVTLMAASKTFNVAGLSCAFAVISNEELRRNFMHNTKHIVGEVNALGYTATLAAFRDCEYWRGELLDYLRGNRDIVYDFVNDEIDELSMCHVEATYLAWLDCRGIGVIEPASFFERAGVGLSDGRYFDGEGFLRLNFGCPRKRLLQGLERMKKALKAR